MRRSRNLTRISGVTAAAAIGAGLCACNALTGASDLAIGEPAVVVEADAGPSPVDAATPPPLTDADTVDAPDADGGPSCEPSGLVESVTGNPQAAVDDARVGTIPWKVQSASPLLVARAELDDQEVSHWLVLRGYGLAVPTPSIVRGITVTVRRSAGSPNVVADQGVALVRGNDLGTPKTLAALWGAQAESAAYGSATDLWAATWAPGDLTSTTFGVAVAARNNTMTNRGTAFLRVTAVTVRVSFERCK